MYSALDEAWPAFETFTSNTPKLDCKLIQEHLQQCEHCRNMCFQTVRPSVVEHLQEPTTTALAAKTTSLFTPEFKDVMMTYLLGVLVLMMIVKE